MLVAPLIPDRS